MTAPLACRRRFLRRAACAIAWPAVPLAAHAGPLAERVPSLAPAPDERTLSLASTPGERALSRVHTSGERALSLVHTHTHERLELVYAVDGNYVADALGSLDRFLRDHYTGDVGRMDPQVFDIVHRVQALLGHRDAVEVISGYRAPATNARLRETRGGGVATRSLHMDGRAIDVRLRGVPLAEVRDAALSLHAGGVGYYPHERFVHLDNGRVRRW